MPSQKDSKSDRLLISQALVDGIPIVGADVCFDTYGVTRIW